MRKLIVKIFWGVADTLYYLSVVAAMSMAAYYFWRKS